MYSFTGHLITQHLITQLPVSHGHQHQTACSEVWTQETGQLRILCDKRVYVPNYRYSHNIRGFWGQFDTFCDFLRFLISHCQKTWKVMFFWNVKKRKIRILEHWPVCRRRTSVRRVLHLRWYRTTLHMHKITYSSIYTVSQTNSASVIFWITPWNIGQL